MTKREKLIECIDGMNSDEFISLHNDYCDAAGFRDDRIYSAQELDDLLSFTPPVDILCMGFHGSVNPHHAFFWFNGYGNIESADYISGTPAYTRDIVDYILLEEDALENDEIQYILDEEDEDNE